MLRRAIAALAMAATTGGCMQYLVQPPRPSLAGTPADRSRPNSYVGGKVQQPSGHVTPQAMRERRAARPVLVERNFWQGFVNWITLGMVAPATIEYSCANAGEPPMGGGGS